MSTQREKRKREEENLRLKHSFDEQERKSSRSHRAYLSHLSEKHPRQKPDAKTIEEKIRLYEEKIKLLDTEYKRLKSMKLNELRLMSPWDVVFHPQINYTPKEIANVIETHRQEAISYATKTIKMLKKKLQNIADAPTIEAAVPEEDSPQTHQFLIVPINPKTGKPIKGEEPIPVPIDGTEITIGRSTWKTFKDNLYISRQTVKIRDSKGSYIVVTALRDEPKIYYTEEYDYPLKGEWTVLPKDQSVPLMIFNKVTILNDVLGFKITDREL